MHRGDEPAVPATFSPPPPFHVEAQGHRMDFYPDGRDRRAALLELIGSARERLDIAFYIFAPDESGRMVRDALTEAARRGVAVTLILDGFGATADEAFFAPFVAAGGQYRSFMATFSVRFLIRNHQKMVIADGRRVMMGGFNVEDDYFAPPHAQGWNDLAFIIEGEVVERIQRWFGELNDWASHADAQFADIRRKLRHWDSGQAPVQLLIGGPTRGLSSWARCVGRDLLEGERLDMIMAYFSPPGRLLRRICRIARRGNARLVLAGKSDNGATIGASRSLYAKLLGAGARIWEFDSCKLHTKLIVLDDAVYLGSANFDMRSLYINLEIVLRIEDKAFAQTMRGFVARHVAASVPITPELHRTRSGVWTRLRWWASWFLVTVVDYTVTRKLNLGL